MDNIVVQIKYIHTYIHTPTVVRKKSPTFPFSTTLLVASSYNDDFGQPVVDVYSFKTRQRSSCPIERFLEVNEIMIELFVDHGPLVQIFWHVTAKASIMPGPPCFRISAGMLPTPGDLQFLSIRSALSSSALSMGEFPVSLFSTSSSLYLYLH